MRFMWNLLRLLPIKRNYVLRGRCNFSQNVNDETTPFHFSETACCDGCSRRAD